MYVFDLGKLPGQQSMLVFHSLARMGVEALVIVSPKSPLASVGYFQDTDKEIDLDFCSRAHIPVMRREVGGGTTYLDENQIFYQVIWKRGNPNLPKGMKRIFSELSQPACETYQEFGIDASFRPENDIITGTGKKIAGEGGGDIGDCMVFVGGILMDFNCDTMSKVIKVPDEKFRDKVFKTMEENLTTMKQELGQLPPRQDIIQILVERFEKRLGKLEKASLDNTTIHKIMELERGMSSDRFLFKKTPRIPKGVKIKQGLEILYGIYKARGGIIRTVDEVHENVLKELAISGDFQFYPKEDLMNLERCLKMTDFKEKTIISKIDEFYEKQRVDAPGVDPEDITKAIVGAQN
ncbi:MAG: lipoate--protein ligase family protein [Thermodesulfobacteriota bacterium]